MSIENNVEQGQYIVVYLDSFNIEATSQELKESIETLLFDMKNSDSISIKKVTSQEKSPNELIILFENDYKVGLQSVYELLNKKLKSDGINLVREFGTIKLCVKEVVLV